METWISPSGSLLYTTDHTFLMTVSPGQQFLLCILTAVFKCFLFFKPLRPRFAALTLSWNQTSIYILIIITRLARVHGGGGCLDTKPLNTCVCVCVCIVRMYVYV